MKKILSIITIFLLTIAFIGCGQTTTAESTTVSTTETTTEQTTTEATTILSTTELPTTIEPVEYTSISMTQQSQYFFDLDEAFDKSTVEVTAYLNNGTSEVIQSELVSVRGYDSSSAGLKKIYLIFDRFLIETEVYVLKDYAIEIDMPYYEAALNLKGASLKVTLNNIITNDFIPLLYGDARNILQESDIDPNNSNNIILVYTGDSVVGTWDGGATWNREHTWPQSRLGVYVKYGDDDFPSKATDVHNLKPADPGENTSRSNDYFDNTGGTDFYEPRDEVKGDVARILFYMSTRYFDLTLNDDEQSSTSLKTMGMISLLLAWNEMDPVDDFERNRNEVIYTYQGNRNPFIDYPEFADLIWGDLA